MNFNRFNSFYGMKEIYHTIMNENNNKIKLTYTGQYVEARKVLLKELNMNPEDVAVMTDSEMLNKLAEEFFELYKVNENGDVDYASALLVKKSDFNELKKIWLMR